MIKGIEYEPACFFDVANRYAGLDAKNDPLLKIDALSHSIKGQLQSTGAKIRHFSRCPIVVFIPNSLGLGNSSGKKNNGSLIISTAEGLISPFTDNLKANNSSNQ
ncbi:MAG: hypothetical protein GY847_00815 [Proteobacteria bacterium]|nr:hypothetical protein [Pseudomonadota bacterium]